MIWILTQDERQELKNLFTMNLLYHLVDKRKMMKERKKNTLFYFIFFIFVLIRIFNDWDEHSFVLFYFKFVNFCCNILILLIAINYIKVPRTASKMIYEWIDPATFTYAYIKYTYSSYWKKKIEQTKPKTTLAKYRLLNDIKVDERDYERILAKETVYYIVFCFKPFKHINRHLLIEYWDVYNGRYICIEDNHW